MEMSVREARAQFAHALAAAQGGERVTITKNGKPIAELGPPSPVKIKRKWTWEELDALQERLGIPKPSSPLDDKWLEEFNSPDWSEELFGPEFR
jgi:prevent-host-death family protein